MRHYLLFPFVACFFISTSLFAQLPANYRALPAEQKQDLLWSEITKSHEENPLPHLNDSRFKNVLVLLKGLFNLKPTFDHESDEIPKGRAKIIHANGSVGKVTFVADSGHPFTGIYKKNAIGLARLSTGVTPEDNTFVPGMALKFFISYRPSVNLHVMNSLEGQNGDWNFFENTFSNAIPHPTGWVLKAIEKIFEWTRKPANELPLWHLASITSGGFPVLKPVAPEKLEFVPSETVKHIIPATSREDFRTSLLQIPYGPLYEVYGYYQNTRYHLGTLMLESKLLASEYGDKKLFFQHQR